jgi:hypothetical protein
VTSSSGFFNDAGKYTECLYIDQKNYISTH